MSYSNSTNPGFFYRDGNLYDANGLQWQTSDATSEAISTIANTMQSFQSPIPYGSPLEQSVREVARQVIENEIFEHSYHQESSEPNYSSLDGNYQSCEYRGTRRLRSHLDMAGGRLTNIMTPKSDNDAVTKAYVDSQLSLAMANLKEELKKEMLGDGIEALKLRVRTFSLIEETR